MELVNHAGTALTRIVESVKEVAELVSDIATASAEQATGLEQINKALMQMDEVTQQNSALVEENAATAKTLEHQAKAMDEQVAFFQIGNAAGIHDVPRAKEPVDKPASEEKTVAPVAVKTAARKQQPVVALKRVASGGNSGGPARRMRTVLATAVNADAEWKDF